MTFEFSWSRLKQRGLLTSRRDDVFYCTQATGVALLQMQIAPRNITVTASAGTYLHLLMHRKISAAHIRPIKTVSIAQTEVSQDFFLSLGSDLRVGQVRRFPVDRLLLSLLFIYKSNIKSASSGAVPAPTLSASLVTPSSVLLTSARCSNYTIPLIAPTVRTSKRGRHAGSGDF